MSNRIAVDRREAFEPESPSYGDLIGIRPVEDDATESHIAVTKHIAFERHHVIKEYAPLGACFHKQQMVVIHITTMTGSGVIQTREIGEDNKTTGALLTFKAYEGMVLEIPRRNAYLIRLPKGARFDMVFIGRTEHDDRYPVDIRPE